tara:strand:- start:22 stop:162 length:141 start_codon:yes stop_codon:yes gene_type:complete
MILAVFSNPINERSPFRRPVDIAKAINAIGALGSRCGVKLSRVKAV